MYSRNILSKHTIKWEKNEKKVQIQVENYLKTALQE